MSRWQEDIDREFEQAFETLMAGEVGLEPEPEPAPAPTPSRSAPTPAPTIATADAGPVHRVGFGAGVRVSTSIFDQLEAIRRSASPPPVHPACSGDEAPRPRPPSTPRSLRRKAAPHTPKRSTPRKSLPSATTTTTIAAGAGAVGVGVSVGVGVVAHEGGLPATHGLPRYPETHTMYVSRARKNAWIMRQFLGSRGGKGGPIADPSQAAALWSHWSWAVPKPSAADAAAAAGAAAGAWAAVDWTETQRLHARARIANEWRLDLARLHRAKQKATSKPAHARLVGMRVWLRRRKAPLDTHALWSFRVSRTPRPSTRIPLPKHRGRRRRNFTDRGPPYLRRNLRVYMPFLRQ